MVNLNPVEAVHAAITPPLSQYARNMIAHLDLSAHPEGGWYKRTWQSPLEYADSARPLASLIYFLLPEGDFSDWHLVDADELWLWHGPAEIELEVCDVDPRSLSADELKAQTTRTVLSVRENNAYGAAAQCLVRAGQWQRTLPTKSDALVSCVVSPGFTFNGFTVITEEDTCQ
ncbi:MAG: cupin domain-containing protein [Alloscardovia omnicolens]|uniref:cupin domain-containing protein n=1 Tax=Alloscardovia omnicolens TaxID=419015 RepID=UPI00242BED14|nr:cupin domain-containing protein [Alloscardovia omnicolens]MBS6346298.1 cupin domain-containing protein [Alloscardovia omnicolens]MDK8650093.1 cupin domain-containing protein [Alloscardovia omnicolens]MDU3532723.1 cupin domain-containing protein [Alloscardovia omnicolens]